MKQMKRDAYTLDFVSDHNNYYLGSSEKIIVEKVNPLLLQDLAIYHIEELTFDDQAPRKEAFENVISSLRMQGVSFLYLILGDTTGVHFYFGVVRNTNEQGQLSLQVNDIGEHILEPSLRGNFRGSKINEIKPKGKKEIIEEVQSMEYFGLLEGVPGIDEDKESFQGVDRLVDVMLGDEFGLAIISKPLNQQEITEIEKHVYEAYAGIVPFVKKSIQEGTSTGTSGGETKTVNHSDTNGTSSSKTTTVGETKNYGGSSGTTKTITKGTTKGSNNSSSSSTESNSGAEGSSDTKTWGTTTSESGTTTGGTSSSKTSGESVAKSNSVSHNKSDNITLEFVNKEAQDWVKYLDEVILPRLDYGKSKGLFVSTAVLFSNNKGNLIKLGNTMKSLYSGKSGNKVPLNLTLLENERFVEWLKNFQLPHVIVKNTSQNELHARASLSQYVTHRRAYAGNWISTNELSLIAGLPQKEVVGLSLKEEVEFGLNFRVPVSEERKITLGSLVQSGRVFEQIEVSLDKNTLNKHVFVTGVTGSGKTTTCQKLLMDSDLPFLVIEPAKTEYRILTKEYEDILIFTLGKNTVAPFRLNPFEFFEHENITSRVDMIKASLEASFDMEAAIPQILETALYECYEDFGWNIATNQNEKYENPFADGVYAFPTLENLIHKIESVVHAQGFDDRLKNDYIGSIKARLQSLLVGSKGLMLNTKRSINFESLIEQRVVLELEEIKSSSEKSLIMGFVLTNLVEAIKAKYFKSGEFRHITLIEEAHRLLSKFMPGDSMNKKQGVEAFTDMLAEVRKYGESLIIVDQIPDKLTSEVLKNTNTKIVHRIFARDDKEAIGNTMALKDEQKDFLSNLEVGRAIVFTQGWSKALQVQIKPTTNTTGEEIIPEGELRRNILLFYQRNYKTGVLQGLEYLEEEPGLEFLEGFIDFLQSDKLAWEFKKFVNAGTTKFKFREHVEALVSIYPIDMLIDYLTHKFYIEETDCSLVERRDIIKEMIQAILEGTIVENLYDPYDDVLKIRRF